MVVRRREIYHVAINPVFLSVFWYLLEFWIYFPDLSLQRVLFRETDVYLQFLSEAPGKLLRWYPVPHLQAELGRQGERQSQWKHIRGGGASNRRKPLLIVCKLYSCNDFQSRDCFQHTRRVKKNNSCQQMNLWWIWCLEGAQVAVRDRCRKAPGEDTCSIRFCPSRQLTWTCLYSRMSPCMFICFKPLQEKCLKRISTGLSFCKNLSLTCSDPSWNDSMPLKTN